MPSPQARLEADVKSAMKARDTERLGTLRMLLTSVKNRRIELQDEVDEKEFVTLVRRAVKQRHEAAAQYRKGDRPELAEKEESEIGHLEAYLPQAPSDDEIRAAIEELIAEQELSGPKAMGAVMKGMMAKFGAAADGAQINKIARQLLTS